MQLQRALDTLDTLERLLSELRAALSDREFTACVICGLLRPVTPKHRPPKTCGTRCRKRLWRLHQHRAQA